MEKKKVYAYIDGSNFYHLSKSNFKITKLRYDSLVNHLLNKESEELALIRYYVAPVNQQEKPLMYSQQMKFFEMIKKTPSLSLHLGKLVSRPLNKISISCPLCGIQESEELQCPSCENKIKLSDTYKTHEKGVDVSMAIHLILDGLENKYDIALIFSSDADFCPAIKYIIEELNKEIIYCRFPFPKTDELIQTCSETRKITKKIIEESVIKNKSTNSKK
jgi:uncharacterized LabA/DUF88 family protein